MFYGLQNLDHESRSTYVQFIFIVSGARHSLPVNNISEWIVHVIDKVC